jgi:pimeloyl-ACP methyl ester carboxylesterase
MPYVEINDARIFYREYGKDDSARITIVLIHGSTVESRTDWETIAPALGKHYRVFTPDCRGHGRSNNPHTSYSFRELATDVAAFVRRWVMNGRTSSATATVGMWRW